MSGPIDTPLNINIMVEHTEKVVQPAKTEMGQNSTFQSSLGLEKKDTRKTNDKKDQSKRKKKRAKDRFEPREDTKVNEELADINTETTPKSAQDSDEESKPLLGKKIDLLA